MNVPCWFVALVLLAGISFSQDAATPETSRFDQQSLSLRTALHYDPALAQPLDALVALYQKGNRIEDLIALYRGHISNYPDDAGAKVVMARILRKLNRAEAGEWITTAAQLHPENPVIQHLLYQHLKDRNDPGALEALSNAITLETEMLERRDGWLEELLKESGEGKGREFGIKHLTALLNLENHTVETLRALATRMQRYQFWELSLGAVTKGLEKGPDAESAIELQILASKAEAALGNRESAGMRLDQLLSKLAADHWRRPEVMSLRVNFLAGDEEREAMLAKAKATYEANPKNETAVLDYVELLAASELRRNAVEILKEAAVALPNSGRLEQKTIELLERLGDERELAEYLSKRLGAFPDRDDLRYLLVKTQFLQGKPKEATEAFREILSRISDEDREGRLLDLARFLRGESLPGEAQVWFGEFLKAAPNRLDVRRELAETHLMTDQRANARAVVGEMNVTDSEIENFLDVVQFMIREEFYTEAKSALEQRLKAEPAQFDLRLLLTKVLGKTGDRDAAEALLSETRELADTAGRYRNWLGVSMEVHELFDDVERFFDREQARFGAAGGENPEAWTSAEIEKFLILCEAGERSRLTERVAQAIRTQLGAGNVTPEVRLELRKLLVKALEKQNERAPELEEQLKLLATEDVKRKDEYDLRRALLYHGLSRPDLAGEALAGLDVSKVTDVALLRSAVPVFIEYGLARSAKSALERVTESEPDELINWKKRLSLLAALGSEADLRKVIRDLLAKSEKLELSLESVAELQGYLLDSHWRTIAGLLAKGTPDALAEVLPLLESARREAATEDQLWSLWARAFVLNKMGREKARDSAIEELASVAAQGNANAGTQTQISFPDGLAISLGAAIDLLGEANPAAAEISRGKTEGPVANPNMAWAFETDPGAHVLQFEPIGERFILVLDDRGTIYAVEKSTGKLIWRETYGLEERGLSPVKKAPVRIGGRASGVPAINGIQIANQFYRVHQNGTSITVQQLVAPFQTAHLGAGGGTISGGVSGGATSNWDASPVKKVRQFATDGDGLFYLTFGGEIQARRAVDGAIVWSAYLETAAESDITLAVEEGRLIAFSPGAGLASGFSADNGKLIWERRLSRAEGVNLFDLNSGLSADKGRVFLFGGESVVLNAKTGERVWKFDEGAVRTFPVALLKSNKETLVEGASGYAEISSIDQAGAPGFLDHLVNSAGREMAAKSFTKNSGALVAPAVHWSATRLSSNSPSSAALAGDRLLLFDRFGMRVISLQLPLASHHYAVSGTFLGVAGENAWFLNRDSLTRVDFGEDPESSRAVSVISLAGLVKNGDSGGVLSGSRVYATGNGGLAVFNAHSGRLITESVWGKKFSNYRTKFGTPLDPALESATRYVSGNVVKSRGAGMAVDAMNLLERTSGAMIYTKVGTSSVVGVRGQ